MEIGELQQRVDEWIKTYGVRYFSELTNMAVLTEEVGELAAHHGPAATATSRPKAARSAPRSVWPRRWPT